MGFYRWVVGDLLSGRISRTIDVKGSWTTVFDAADTLRVEFPIYSFRPQFLGGAYGDGVYGEGLYGIGELSTIERAVWPDALAETAPGKSFLAVAWVDDYDAEHWIAGGPIWAQDLDEASGTMTLGAAGMESYYDHRFVLPVLAADQYPEGVTSYWQAKSLSLLAKRLVEQAHTWVNGDPPVVLPSDASLGGAGVVHERNYPGYELGRVGQRLRQLSEVNGGPEYQFVPRRAQETTATPNNLEWAMDIAVEADDMMLTQDGPPWLVDLTVPRSMVVNIQRKVDGSVLATDIYAAGQGQGEGRPIRYATSAELLGFGYPRLDGEKTSLDSVSNPKTLQAHADGELARRAWPAETFAVTVDADTWWWRSPGARAGDWLTLRSHGRVMFPDGDNELRILTISANDDATVSLACVPKREVA